MAEILAARREIRRRKILANSGNRLQIITGKSDDECPKELLSSVSPESVPEPEYEIPEAQISSSFSRILQQNGVVLNELEPCQFLLPSPEPSHEIDASGDSEVASDLSLLLPPASGQAPAVSFWEKASTHKYDIVLLSLVVQMLYGMSLITFDNGYFFLPVIVYIVTKMMWFPVQSTSNIANVLLLLNGMSQTKVRNIMYLTQCFSVITCDTFVYLFTTICIQSLWIAIRDILVT